MTTISTRRTLRTLLDAEGRTLAEVCDDVVTTTGPRGDQAWREWEVELGPHGDTALLDAVEVLLLAAGAQVSDTPSKQARALGRLPKRLRAVPALPGRGSSTGELVQAFVRTQTATLVTADPALRSGDLAQRTAAVHEARLSVRRLRSTLTAYAALLDPAATQPLAEEPALVRPAARRGPRRPRHRRAAADRRSRACRPSLVLGPVAARVDTHFAGAEQRAARAVTAALGGRRYYRLLDALDALAADPPLTEAAQAPAAKGLEQVLRHEWKRLDRRARAALAGPGEAADGTSADEPAARHAQGGQAAAVRRGVGAAGGRQARQAARRLGAPRAAGCWATTRTPPWRSTRCASSACGRTSTATTRSPTACCTPGSRRWPSAAAASSPTAGRGCAPSGPSPRGSDRLVRRDDDLDALELLEVAVAAGRHRAAQRTDQVRGAVGGAARPLEDL
nr:CHAD domain-containing protein [Angustibacter aerolatus]